MLGVFFHLRFNSLHFLSNLAILFNHLILLDLVRYKTSPLLVIFSFIHFNIPLACLSSLVFLAASRVLVLSLSSLCCEIWKEGQHIPKIHFIVPDHIRHLGAFTFFSTWDAHHGLCLGSCADSKFSFTLLVIKIILLTIWWALKNPWSLGKKFNMKPQYIQMTQIRDAFMTYKTLIKIFVMMFYFSQSLDLLIIFFR